MNKLNFSIVVPVYNRPKEIEELLHSLTLQDYKEPYEVLIIEDGSSNSSEEIVAKYKQQLNITYYYKQNSGAGASRNYGMQRATGNYFVILDSDVLVPKSYLTNVAKALSENYTDAFGGPDKAHESFTSLQKAINYSMTSVLTTGGIRGKKKSVGKFQPRSFNMGLSKKAFEKTKGYADYKVGEDIDLTFRLWKEGFETQLISNAYVYHKRRSTIKQFFKQTYAFGTARPQLNRRFPSTKKITYWFPSLFFLGLLTSIILSFTGYTFFLGLYIIYFIALFLNSFIENRSLQVAFLSIISTLTQFVGYGTGFLKSYLIKNKLT